MLSIETSSANGFSGLSLVSSMLEKSPELRPQLPDEVAASCYHIIQELGLQTPSVLTPPRPHAPQAILNTAWRTHLPWAIPLTALITLFGVWTLNANDPSEAIQFPQNKPIAPSVLPRQVMQEASSQETAKKKPDSSETASLPVEVETKGTAPLQSKALDKAPAKTEQLEPIKLESSESSMEKFGLNWNFTPDSPRPLGSSSLFEFTEEAPLTSDSPEKPFADDVSIDSTLPPD